MSPRAPSRFAVVIAAGTIAAAGCARGASHGDDVAVSAEPPPPPAPLPSAAPQPEVGAPPSPSARGSAPCVAAAQLRRFRRNPTLSLLGDGTVLIVGGKQHDDSGFVADVDRFDPKTRALRPAAPLRAARARHRAAVAGDGRVVVASGRVTSTIEVYDPKADRWSTAGSMKQSVVDPIVVTLPSGDVLIAGGDLMWKDTLTDEALVWQAKTGKLRAVAKLPDALMGRYALRLIDDRVVLVETRFFAGEPPVTAPDAIFDEAHGTWKVGPIDDALVRTLHALPRNDLGHETEGELLRRPAGTAPLLTWVDRYTAKEIHAFDPIRHETRSLARIEQMDAAAVMIDAHTAVIAGGDEGQTAVLVCTLGV